jgi:hypothetical protein
VRFNSSVSPFVGKLVLATVCVVAVYTLWQERTGASRYTQPSVGALRAELTSLPVPPGSEPVGAPKLVDRITIATADQNYISDGDPSEVARFYRERLTSDGWRQDMAGNGASHEMWFCKDGVLSAVAFSSESRPVKYRVGLTSGGWASSRCG